MEKAWLKQKYLVEKLSMKTIAELANCSSPTVMNYLKKFNIPSRTISEALKGRKLSAEHKIKVKQTLANNNKRRKQFGSTEKEKQQLRKARPNRAGAKHSPETKALMRQKALGRKNSPEAIKKMSETRTGNPLYSGVNHPLYGRSRDDIKGSKHPNWKGGISSIYKRYRRVTKYKEWRTKCYERDDYTCQICTARGVELNVDHIKPFALILKENNINTIEQLYACKELWALDNGRTLCISCHRQTETYGGGTKKLIKELRK